MLCDWNESIDLLRKRGDAQGNLLGLDSSLSFVGIRLLVAICAYLMEWEQLMDMEIAMPKVNVFIL